MNSDPFVSYAQNGEDVLLWRALGHVSNGRYVDVGAADPSDLSVTKAFYDRGWRGVDVEPTPQHAQALREERPDDLVVEAAVTASDVTSIRLHEIRDQSGAKLTGLSTLVDDIASTHTQSGYVVHDLDVPVTTLSAVFDSAVLGGVVHFLKIDVEGAEADVLRSMDFEKHRPWVVVVEATQPLETEATHQEWDPILVDANYEFALFDGLSRYYVAAEHPELKAALSYPVCVFDDFITARELRVNAHIAAVESARDAAKADGERLWADVLHWRGTALESWAQGFVERDTAAELERAKAQLQRRGPRGPAAVQLRAQVDRMETSVSWRVTKPLRWVRSHIGAVKPAGKAAR